jgi:hypothetical protein
MRQLYIALGVIMGWFAASLQFYLLILNRKASIPETIIRYFSFFTILTNILVAVTLTFILFKSKSRLGKFFEKPATLTAVTVYIVIVGAVYNLILRQLWAPTGLQKLVDELLHSAVPIYFVVFWLMFVLKEDLKWKDTFSWLIYPLIYLLIIIFRGSISGYYPYPFVNVSKLGYEKVLINSAVLFAVFWGLSLAFVGIGKLISKAEPDK